MKGLTDPHQQFSTLSLASGTLSIEHLATSIKPRVDSCGGQYAFVRLYPGGPSTSTSGRGMCSPTLFVAPVGEGGLQSMGP